MQQDIVLIIVEVSLGVFLLGVCFSLCYFGIGCLKYCRRNADANFDSEFAEASIRNETSATFEQNTCGICLEEMLPVENLFRARPCRHKFHKECLERWLEQENRCPICNGRVQLTPIAELLYTIYNNGI